MNHNHILIATTSFMEILTRNYVSKNIVKILKYS